MILLTVVKIKGLFFGNGISYIFFIRFIFFMLYGLKTNTKQKRTQREERERKKGFFNNVMYYFLIFFLCIYAQIHSSVEERTVQTILKEEKGIYLNLESLPYQKACIPSFQYELSEAQCLKGDNCFYGSLSSLSKVFHICANFSQLIVVCPQEMIKRFSDSFYGYSFSCIPIEEKKEIYNAIDLIEDRCLEVAHETPEYKTFLICLGEEGKVLAKRLWYRLQDHFLFLLDSIPPLNRLEIQNKRGKCKIFATAALLEERYEERKKEYQRSLKLLKEFGYLPYIFESCRQTGPTFLDSCALNIHYTNTQDARIKNKGVSEVRSLLKGLEDEALDPEEMVVKITGRYSLTSPYFLDLVENSPDVDVFVKYRSDNPEEGVFSGCFAMRARFFIEMLLQLDLEKMENEMIDLEKEILRFVNRLDMRGKKVVFVNRLDMVAHIAGGGNGNPTKTLW